MMNVADQTVDWPDISETAARGLVEYALEMDGAELVARLGRPVATALVLAIGSRETLWGRFADGVGDGFGLLQVLPRSSHWDGLNAMSVNDHVRAGVRHLVEELDVIEPHRGVGWTLLALAIGFNGGIGRARWMGTAGGAGVRPIMAHVEYTVDVIGTRFFGYLGEALS